jgi:hypothetical protein
MMPPLIDGQYYEAKAMDRHLKELREGWARTQQDLSDTRSALVRSQEDAAFWKIRALGPR